ncbi:DUF6010 family protein [Pseudonocardia nematodicida]|uniref:DUF6010 family protein n=1 Tax=Pseudonocardia nematodicida TaxID=1206997 RepID=A0ABV1K917_9PSEU
MSILAPILVGVVYVVLASLIPEPGRQKFNAVMVAGAGAAYISSGALGLWELAFTAVVTTCAYLGLRDYRWLGVGWLLHTAWDVVHHLKGAPIIPALSHSSFGCAICDPVIAIWLFRGAPAVTTRTGLRTLVGLDRATPRPGAGRAPR